MAIRRMFSLTIVDTDAFLEMPMSTQLLYFHLSMRADDEGFVSSPKRISRLVGCSEDDLKVLTAKRFILSFDSGVVVIKHWLIHNTIRMDRFKETTYKKEKEMLTLNEFNAYTEVRKPNGNQMETNRQPKLSKDKLSKDKLSYIANSNELVEGNEINKVMEIFYDYNQMINFGNKTQRDAIKDLAKKITFKDLKVIARYALDNQGKQYFPVITTPVQLKNKFGDLKAFYEKQKNTPSKFTTI